MYTDYWQLDRKPFEPSTAGGFFYASESHRGALLKLRYAIENGRGAAVVAGPSGCGKTLLVEKLIEQLPASATPVVQVVYPQMSSRELLAYLVARLAPTVEMTSTTPSVDQSWFRLETLLAEANERGERPLIVMDEAQLLEDSGGLETVRLLLNLQTKGQTLLTLLLIGQTGLLSTLSRTPRLEERVDITALLDPLSADEVATYVEHRLQAAGAKPSIFTPGGIDALQAATHGIPRRINRLGDLALLVGYANKAESIDANLIESVSNELALARAA